MRAPGPRVWSSCRFAVRSRRVGACLTILLTLLMASPVTADTWTLGVQPFASPPVLFERYAPLRDWIAEERGDPVFLESSRDLSQFIERLHDERYEIAIVAPHVVPLLDAAGPYAPVARSRDIFAIVIVAPADSAIRSLTDLEGTTLATPFRHSIGATLARTLLEIEFAPNEPAVEYLEFPHHQGATSAMLLGLADASVVVIDGVALQPREETVDTARLIALADGTLARIIAQSESFPGFTVVLHQRARSDDLGRR